MKKIIKNNSLLFTLLIFILGVTLSCEVESNFGAPVREVAFKATSNATLINAGSDVFFDDKSLDVASRKWTFQGGNITTSDQKEVSVNFPKDGKFLATLEVKYTNGKTQKNSFNVKVYPRIEASFTSNVTNGPPGTSITYENASLNGVSEYPESVLLDGAEWEFEGGIPATSKLAKPVVTYPNLGTFKVKLKARRQAPYDTNEIVKEGYVLITNIPLISPQETKLRYLGSKIEVLYTQALPTLTPANIALFSVKVNNSNAVIESIALDPTNAKKILLKLQTPVKEGQLVSMSLKSGILSTLGAPLAPLVDLAITNSVVNLYAANNGGLELGALGGLPTGFGTWNGTASNPQKYALVNTDVNEGTKCLKIGLDNDGKGWILEAGSHIPLELGGTYVLTVWAKATGTGAVLNFRAVSPGFTHQDSKTVNLTNQWMAHSFEFSTAGNTVLSRKYWQQIASNSTQNVFIDNISLYRID
jgi:PKD repeat protein